MLFPTFPGVVHVVSVTARIVVLGPYDPPFDDYAAFHLLALTASVTHFRVTEYSRRVAMPINAR